ncbi:MAG: histone deacetylase [Thermodesulfobacteriota bacterium]|nr:histone deacetylase [Thermodesulfobacteriota bacterium]
MEELKKCNNLLFFQPEPISQELLLTVHTPEMLEEVKYYQNYEPSLYSSYGCVLAVEKLWEGEFDNAFVFFGCCHHAGPDYAWGGCAISGIGPAIKNLRKKHNVKKFAILDTDAHHGDGTRAIFKGDKDILHVCFCGSNRIEDNGTKICIQIPGMTTDENYLKLVEEHFIRRVETFGPEMIVHLLGHDTAEGDYGSCGLSNKFFIELVKMIKNCSRLICNDRYVIMTGGGYRCDIAEFIFPEIIKAMAEIS